METREETLERLMAAESEIGRLIQGMRKMQRALPEAAELASGSVAILAAGISVGIDDLIGKVAPIPEPVEVRGQQRADWKR